jgi:hypothetical protein
MQSLRTPRPPSTLLATLTALAGQFVFAGWVHAGGFCRRSIAVPVISATPIQATTAVIPSVSMIQLSPVPTVSSAPMIQLSPVQMVRSSPLKKRKNAMTPMAQVAAAPSGLTVLTHQDPSVKIPKAVGGAPSSSGKLSPSDRNEIVASLKNQAEAKTRLGLSGPGLRDWLLPGAQVAYSAKTGIKIDDFGASDNKAIAALITEATGDSALDDVDADEEEAGSTVQSGSERQAPPRGMLIPHAAMTTVPMTVAPIQQLFLPVPIRHHGHRWFR